MSYAQNRAAYGYSHQSSSSHTTARPEYSGDGAYVHPSRQQAVPAQPDFSAPIIHFGTSREVQPRQSMKDQHFVRAQDDKIQSLLTPATKEQRLLTLFVASIPPKLDDYWVERILKSCAKLRQWKRAVDGNGVPQDFGFAEYEDPDHLSRAYNILKDLELPQAAISSVEKYLLASMDEMSRLYLEDVFAARASTKDDNKERSAMASAKHSIEKAFRDFCNPNFRRPDNEQRPAKAQKPTTGTNHDPSAITIMLSIEDELGDIPEDQRADIAREITSFRERSARRDLERAKKLEDVEARRLEFERASRLDANDNSRQNVDEKEEVVLIRRTAKPRPALPEEAMMTDHEIEQYREEKRKRNLDLRLLEEERKWHGRETNRLAVLEKESSRNTESSNKRMADARHMNHNLASWDDTMESKQATHSFYRDQAGWSRSRALYKERELMNDQQNILEEERAAAEKMASVVEITEDQKQPSKEFLKNPSVPLRVTLGKRMDESKKPTVNAEAILENDELESHEKKKRTLIPLVYEDDITAKEDASDPAQRQARLQSIVANIPTSKTGLWEFPRRWERLDSSMLEKIRSFVGKKLVEAIGMEEEDLNAFILRKIQDHDGPDAIEQELNMAIGDSEEAEMLTLKCWRFLLILLETAGH